MESKRAISALLTALSLVLSGCGRVWAETRPIRELRIIETVGCDLSPEGVTLSVCASKPTLKQSQAAPSFRLAMDRLRDKAASPALFFAHTRYLLAGEALARADLAPVLDLAARSADMRLKTPLFVLTGASAAEAVQLGAEDRDVTQMLAALQADMAQQGTSHAFTCGEILLALSERGAALAAACAVEDGALARAGYAILKGNRCVGQIGAPEDQAVALLRSLGGHGDVRLGNDTVTISSCKAAYRPRWDGGALAGLDVSLEMTASLTETDGTPGAAGDAARRRLEKDLADAVCRWSRALISRGQALQADFLDLRGAVASAAPMRWAAIRGDWDALFPTLPVTVTAEAKIDRTLDLQQPIEPNGGAR